MWHPSSGASLIGNVVRLKVKWIEKGEKSDNENK